MAFTQALATFQAGDETRAAQLCHAILATEPAHIDALLLLALIEERQGHHEEAAHFVERVLRSDGDCVEALALYGTLLRTLGRLHEALAAYDRALARRPDYVDVLYNRGNLLQALKRNDEALASYDRILSINPRDIQALHNRGVALQGLGRAQEALECYAHVLTIKPDHPEAFNSRGNALLTLDFPEQALASFDRAAALRPEYAEAWSNRGNALSALGRSQEALASYNRAIELKPAYAEAFNNRSVILLDMHRYEEALISSTKALELRPHYVEALNSRGNVLSALNRHEEALACYEEGFAIQPDSTRALGMGNALQGLQRHQEALACFDKALSIKPDYAEALNNRGNALRALNRHADALVSYGRAIALKPNDVQAHWNEGLTRLALGDFERGWEKYEWRWQNPKLESPRRQYGKPAWLGTRDIEGKTILLYPEQGFGDAIQFVRYVPMVSALGARVLLVCHPKLCELFKSVAGVDSTLTPEQPLPDFDFHAALMSLPLVFKTALNTIPASIPYLSAHEHQVEHWRGRLASHGTRVKVGLVWTGNPRFPAANVKTCPVDRLRPLLDIQGCTFFSLQTGDASADLSRLNTGNRKVVDLSSELESFSDTAAVISVLDVIVSIDTAVAHLAGALGKPTWILLPFSADWRWLIDRDDSPWYPTARLFRQSRAGDWDDAIQRVGRALVHRAAGHPLSR